MTHTVYNYAELYSIDCKMIYKVAVRDDDALVWVISLLRDSGTKALLDFLQLIFEYRYFQEEIRICVNQHVTYTAC